MPTRTLTARSTSCPLCKTGGGSFMILDLDGTPNNCDDEVNNPPAIQFATFPVDVQSDNGNNCAKKMVDEVNAKAGQVVLIPVCDGDCVTGNGSNAVYHVIRVAAFYLDYMSDQNGGNNTACQGNGTTLVPIARQRQLELPRRMVRPLHHVRTRRCRADPGGRRHRRPAREVTLGRPPGTAVA